jgi:hypothetical protein
MVDRYITAPIDVPGQPTGSARADLIFLGVDHSQASFEARIFLDAPEADHTTARDDPAYAGSFFIFGHGGCFGDVGHCDVPRTRARFDLRPPHPLTPAIRVVSITEPLRTRVEEGATSVTVTIVAHAADGASNDVLAFDTVRLALYAETSAPRAPGAPGSAAAPAR